MQATLRCIGGLLTTILQVVTPISFLKKVIFCSSLQYRSALVVTRMRNIVLLTYAWFMAKHYNTQNDSASLPVLRR